MSDNQTVKLNKIKNTIVSKQFKPKLKTELQSGDQTVIQTSQTVSKVIVRQSDMSPGTVRHGQSDTVRDSHQSDSHIVQTVR